MEQTDTLYRTSTHTDQQQYHNPNNKNIEIGINNK